MITVNKKNIITLYKLYYMDKSIDVLSGELDKVLKPLFNNKTFLASLSLFLALYAGMLAPALPNSVVLFFDTWLGKFLFIFAIAFVASRNLPNSMNVALIVSVIFLIGLTTLNDVKLKEQFKNNNLEFFAQNMEINKQNNKKNYILPLIETLDHEIAELNAVAY